MNEESKINHWTTSTISKWDTFRRQLIEFDSQIDLEFQNATILKRFAFLNRYLRWSTKKGYNSNNIFSFFKPKLRTTKKKIIFLTQDELKKLIKYLKIKII